MRSYNFAVGLNMSEQSHLLSPILLIIILLLAALMQVTTDLYTPSLPAIASSLNASVGTIQLTLSIYMLGFSLSHLFYGPISDRIGRKKPLLFGVGISSVGSVICYLAPSATLLILGRFVQAIGIGCCNSVGRSLARDLLSDRLLAKVGSYVGMVSVVILALSPTLGGYIQEYLGWRANFSILFVFALLVWALTLFYLPETNQHLNPKATQIRVMQSNYLILLKNKVFLGYTLCACFSGAGLVAYLTIAPFLLQETLGFSPIEFGWLAFVVAGGIFISGFINSKAVMTLGIARMVGNGAWLMLFGGILMLMFAIFKLLNPWVIMIPVGIFSIGAGFTFINAFAGAFNPFPAIAGTVSALYGFLQDLSAGLSSFIIAMFNVSNQLILSLMLIIVAVLSLFAWQFVADSKESKL